MGYSYQFMDIFIEYGDFPIKSELGFFQSFTKTFYLTKNYKHFCSVFKSNLNRILNLAYIQCLN